MSETTQWMTFILIGLGTFAIRLSFIELHTVLRIPTVSPRPGVCASQRVGRIGTAGRGIPGPAGGVRLDEPTDTSGDTCRAGGVAYAQHDADADCRHGSAVGLEASGDVGIRSFKASRFRVTNTG